MNDAILVLNAGSSSIKFSVFQGDESPDPAGPPLRRPMRGYRTPRAFYRPKMAPAGLWSINISRMAPRMKTRLPRFNAGEKATFRNQRLVVVGHRVVHGGTRYVTPMRSTRPSSPNCAGSSRWRLHQPHHLAAIAAVSKLHPALPQVACFDTAFHHTQPAVATEFALPRRLAVEGIRRYGFHGLSYEYIASVLPEHGRPRRHCRPRGGRPSR